MADQLPAGCHASDPLVTFSGSTTEQLSRPLREGDEIPIGAQIANQSGDAPCDVSNLMVTVTLPRPDGTSGTPIVLASGIDLPAWTSPRDIAKTIPYTVALYDDVFQAPVSMSWSATLHSGSPDQTIGGEVGKTAISVSRPRTSLALNTDISTGQSPLTVTFDYALTNNSPSSSAGLPAPGLIPGGVLGGRALLADPTCGELNYVGGDGQSTGAPVLDPGETWNFRCVKTFGLPGTYSSQPSIEGTSSTDGRAWPQLPAGTSSVTVLGSDMTVDKSHQGDLLAGGTGNYTLKVTNSGNQATRGLVSVTDQLPEGLTADAISGDGWNCELATLTCSRSDRLESGNSYPDVTVAVSVSTSPPKSVINTATVSGGGEPAGATSNNSDSDPTTIRSPSQPEPPKGKVFKIIKVTSRSNGTVTLKVSAPGAGRLKADDAKAPDLVQAASKKTGKAGKYKLVLKAGKKLRRQLKRSRRSQKVWVKVTFTAKGSVKPGSKLARVVPVSFSFGPAGASTAD